MSTLMIGLLIAAGVIGAMVAYRIISSRREEEKFKAEQKAISDSIDGIGTMTSYNRNTTQRVKAASTRAAKTPLRSVSTSKSESTPDDLMLLSSTYATNTPTPMSNYDDDTRKIAGGGGTFDGGGASGNWSPAPTPSCDDASSRSSYDSGSSYSSDSGSSTSSDSGSSSCSSD